MKYAIKIRKRAVELQGVPPSECPQKIERPSEREIANAVKSWIAELAERKRATEHSVLLRMGVQSHAG